MLNKRIRQLVVKHLNEFENNDHVVSLLSDEQKSLVQFLKTSETDNKTEVLTEVSRVLDSMALDYVKQLNGLQKQRQAAILELKHKLLDSAIPEIMLNIDRLSRAEDEKFKHIYGELLENALF